MGKFEVDVVYSGSIRVEVEAMDGEAAKAAAEIVVEEMQDREFNHTIDLGHAETNIVQEVEI